METNEVPNESALLSRNFHCESFGRIVNPIISEPPIS